MAMIKRTGKDDPDDIAEEKAMWAAEDLSVPEEDDGFNTVEEAFDRGMGDRRN
jgi:hypothetical protein